MLYGRPKSFKSFLALDLGLSIAGGRDWGDRTTAQGPVVYVAAEGLAGLGKRIQALEQAYGLHRTTTGEDFYVLPEKVRLLERRCRRPGGPRPAGEALSGRAQHAEPLPGRW